MEPPSARLGCLLFLLTWLIISPSHSSRSLAGELRNSKKRGREEGKQNEKKQEEKRLANVHQTPPTTPTTKTTNTITTVRTSQPQKKYGNTRCCSSHVSPKTDLSCLNHHWLARQTKSPQKDPTSNPPNHTKPPKRKWPLSSLADATPRSGPPSAERLPALSQTRKK